MTDSKVVYFVKKTAGKEDYGLDVTAEEFFFFAFFVILSVVKGLGFYEGQKVFELLVIPAFCCGLIKIVITPYTKRQWVMQTVLLLMTAVTYYESRDKAILFIAFLVLGMKNISVKKVFHVGLWVWSVCSVALSIFSFFRLEHTVYRVHEKLGLGPIFRWSLGFTHPNTFHITYMALCVFILYELGEHYKFRHLLWLMIGNLLVFFYSVSYTGFGIVAVLLAGYQYVKIRPKFCILEKVLANIVLPLLLALSYVIPVRLFSSPFTAFYQKLNFMLNTRLWLAKQFLVPEYLSLFGKDISQVVTSKMTMDSSYVGGLIHFGIIPMAVIMAGYVALIAYDTHKQKTKELVILLCFLGAGWVETVLFSTSFKNLTLIFLGEFLFLQKEDAREYCLCPRLQVKVHVPLAKLPDLLLGRMAGTWKRNKKKLAAIVFAGALAGGLLCAVFYREPKGYVVQRFYTDARVKDFVYLESEDDPDYEGYRVMNYVDSDTIMKAVTGNAVKLETARYYLGSVLIGGFAGGMAGTFRVMRCSSKKAKTGK